MSSERLQEISNIVDSYFNKKSQYVQPVEIIEEETINEVIEEKVVKKNHKGYLIKKLNNKVLNYTFENKEINTKYIEKQLFLLVTKNTDFNKYNTGILFSCFIYLSKLTKNQNIILQVSQLYKTHQKLINDLNNYLHMIYNIDERNKIYSILELFHIDIPYDKYCDSNIKHNLLLSNHKITRCVLKHFSEETTNKYNASVDNFKIQLNEAACQILELKESHPSIYFEEIINALQNKVNNSYSCFYKFNKPELFIYNKLIDFQNEFPQILYIFNHFTLPITRNGLHHLYADFLIVFNIDNIIQFAIIEFDGPTHYNINDKRIRRNQIHCDIIKNNFCMKNSIHILRVFDHDKDYINKIYSFIKNIILDCNKSVFTIIQPYNFYQELLQYIF